MRSSIRLTLLALLPLISVPADAGPVTLLVASQSGTVRQYSLSGQDRGLLAGGLSAPSWLATDSAGNVYVSEYEGHGVVVLSPSGTVLRTIETPFAPGGVEIGSDGTVYVADYFGGRVYRYSAEGKSLGLFAAPGLSRADFLEFDAFGNLYISDFMDGLIRRIDPNGFDLGNFVSGLGGTIWRGPEGMAFDDEGNLFVAVYQAGVIRRYSSTGADLGVFAEVALDAYGLAIDRKGVLYVAGLSGTVEAFDVTGTSLGAFTTATGTRDVLVVPESVPDPGSTLLLLGMGLAGLGAAKRRPVSACFHCKRWHD